MSEDSSEIKYTPDSSDLRQIERDFNHLDEALEMSVYEAMAKLEHGYEDAVQFVGAIDRGNLLRSIGMATNAAKFVSVEPSVGYEGWVEEGAYGRAGRHPARKAIEHFVLGDQYEEILDNTLRQFLYGVVS